MLLAAMTLVPWLAFRLVLSNYCRMTATNPAAPSPLHQPNLLSDLLARRPTAQLHA